MLPKDWNQATLESLCHAPITYGVLKPGEYCTNGTPLLQIKDLLGNLDNQENIHRISDELDFEYRRSKIQVNDILISLVGTVGRIAIVPASLDGANIHRNIARIRTKNYEFLVHYLNSDVAKNRIGLSSSGSSQSALNLSVLRALKVPVPPLPEQQKIAKILSTWDNAISATKRLLENSQQRKKALMQQLLTGKKRLPGFEGEWRLKTLNDLYSFKRGKGLSKDLVIPNGKNKCVLYGELYTKYGEVISSVISKTDSHDGLLSIAGDVLLPSSTTTTGIDLANATAVLEDEVLLGGDIIVLRPKELLDPIFMSHLLTHVKKHEIAVKAQGITIIHLYGSDLKKIAVNIPENYDEQKAIVKVLTTAYQENELLQKRLDHLRLEKKALMQQLLTGKRRVVVDTDAA
ncbi:restriction endonuclease subunit S [Morganella morganii]